MTRKIQSCEGTERLTCWMVLLFDSVKERDFETGHARDCRLGRLAKPRTIHTAWPPGLMEMRMGIVLLLVVMKWYACGTVAYLYLGRLDQLPRSHMVWPCKVNGIVLWIVMPPVGMEDCETRREKYCLLGNMGQP